MSNIKYLTKTALIKRVSELNDVYWADTWLGRWKYMYQVVKELKEINPKTILELGAYKVNLCNISDNMDLNIDFIDVNNLNNKTYIQDATSLPWDIPDKYYDVFVGLQVFEHFENKKQSEVFNEVMRVSKNAILSFPYMWNSPNDSMHHMINDETIKKWTNNIEPVKSIFINVPPTRRRIIFVFKF
mgnify:CR=1 FL=1